MNSISITTKNTNEHGINKPWAMSYARDSIGLGSFVGVWD